LKACVVLLECQRRERQHRLESLCYKFQKINFKAICRIRGSRAEVMRPKVLSATAVSGLFNKVWLNTLKNSARYCRRSRSRIVKTLCAEKSTLKVPGPLRILRPALPKVPSLAEAKADVSNHWAMRAPSGPLV